MDASSKTCMGSAFSADMGDHWLIEAVLVSSTAPITDKPATLAKKAINFGRIYVLTLT